MSVSKNNYRFIIFILSLFLLQGRVSCFPKTSAVTYVDTPGRLGDKLIVYSKAEWISYKHGIPLLYVPLEHFDLFMMHTTDTFYTAKLSCGFKKNVRLRRGYKNFLIEPDKGILYIVNYYSNITIDWNDRGFLEVLREKIAPIMPVQKICYPEGRVSVAVHVRKGGGFDTPIFSEQRLEEFDQNLYVSWKPNTGHKNRYCDCKHPFKFPPDKYYVDQIKKIYEILHETPLYVHIFTDSQKPSRIVEKYKAALAGLDITFSCRGDGESYKNCVIEDLFAMTQFDCLIRSESNFSFFADMLGDYALVAYPISFCWKKCGTSHQLIIDRAKIKINDSFWGV